ncbi:MAG: hypothetical protein R2705_21375 [Ilumatobacteraceae bacterium]
MAYRRTEYDTLFARSVARELERVYGRRSVYLDETSMDHAEPWAADVRKQLRRRTRPWVVYCIGKEWTPSPGVEVEISEIARLGLAASLVHDSDESFDRALEMAPAGTPIGDWLRDRVRNPIGVSDLLPAAA